MSHTAIAPEPPEDNQNKELNLDTHTPGTRAMLARKYNIAGDVVSKALQELPDRQRVTLRWLDGYARGRNLSLDEVGALLVKNEKGETYSRHSVYASLTGIRQEQGASLDAFCKAVEQLRMRMQETTSSRSIDSFIETSLSKKIFRHLRRNFEKKSMTCVFGESQIGKTRTEEEYKTRHNHGETILIRIPTRGSYGEVLEEFAIQCGIPPQNQQKALRRRIIDCFDDRMQLLVDEAHQCFFMKNSTRAIATLDFIREIHDRRKTAVAFFATYIMRQEILNGSNSKLLRQIWLRCRVPALNLPSVPNEKDRALFAEAHGLEPAPDKLIKVEATIIDNDGTEKTIEHRANPLLIETKVLTEWGLGRWLSILDEAKEIAKESGGRMTWGKVITAHAKFEADGEVVK